MVLPKHTFYVDNIFVYQPLPYVKSMYYMDLDLYRYFIGRADQSVNESVMVGRVDQQLRVTKHMIDCQDLDALKDQKRLRAYGALPVHHDGRQRHLPAAGRQRRGTRQKAEPVAVPQESRYPPASTAPCAWLRRPDRPALPRR